VIHRKVGVSGSGMPRPAVLFAESGAPPGPDGFAALAVSPVAVAVPWAAMPTAHPFIGDLLQAAEQHVVTVVVALAWAALIWPLRRLYLGLRPPQLRVYLSATLDDLGPYRAAVIDTLNRPEFNARHVGDPVDAGHPTGQLDDRLVLVRGCDLFIGLYAWRYGPVVTVGTKKQSGSMTDLELTEATRAQVDRALWRLPDSARWRATDMDQPLTDVRALRARVAADPACRELPDSPMALARRVESALVARKRALYPQQQLLADFTAPSGVVLAGVMGTVAVASQLVRDALSHTSTSGLLVAGAALASTAVTYGVRLLVIRLP
jgi:hypothetical protein